MSTLSLNSTIFNNNNKNITVIQSSELDIISPLNQFDIHEILGIDIFNLHLSLTNIGFFLTIGAIFLAIVSLMSTNENKVASNS